LREEGRLAFHDIGGLFDGPTPIPPSELPENVRRALKAVQIKERVIRTRKNGDEVIDRTYNYVLLDKGKALERLSKYLGLYERDNEQKRAESIEEILKRIHG
jgi:hypothetical protein